MAQNAAFQPGPEDNACDVTFSSKYEKEEIQDEKTDFKKSMSIPVDKNDKKSEDERMMWSNPIEFLMSCIAASVGLGNVWRFPFVAYQNGGGAFLIPYIIVLVVVGKPMYYLEGALGQFSSRNPVKLWSMSPAMKGTGYTQALVCGYILSYYVSIVALCIYYFAMSFQSELPWAVCKDEWTSCVPSGETSIEGSVIVNATSSAELYFVKTVLQQSDGIEHGLGLPIWYLTLCLFISWLLIFIIVARGVRSSGKASYFLALFPYVVMIILLITTCLLPGAGSGILFFLTPQWDKLAELDVWYAAVTQVFFSLGVGMGAIIMFSSYSAFRHNVYRDVMIVTTLDTFTSLLSGITIFGILGNLAYNLNQPVGSVVGSGGTSLAFVSYPDAIAKTFQPQLFSVLFFIMMTVLGIGSAVSLLQTINTVLMDSFPRVKVIYVSAICCIIGFLVGLVYVTPGGQYILELVDHYGGNSLLCFAAISEIIGMIWIYGLENVCLDLEFMLSIKTSIYWRVCWGIITPTIMLTVFIYGLVSQENPLFADVYVYPFAGYASGYTMMIFGMTMVPLFMFIRFYKNRNNNLLEMIKCSFRPKKNWGPRETVLRKEWSEFKQLAKTEHSSSTISHIYRSLLGIYRRKVIIVHHSKKDETGGIK